MATCKYVLSSHNGGFLNSPMYHDFGRIFCVDLVHSKYFSFIPIDVVSGSDGVLYVTAEV